MKEKKPQSTFDELIQALRIMLYLIYFAACATVALLESMIAGIALAVVGVGLILFLWTFFGDD